MGRQQPAPLADATALRLAVIVSRFNESVSGILRDGAAAAVALGSCVGAALRKATFARTRTGGKFQLPYRF